VGTRPLNNARGDSSLAISLEFRKKKRVTGCVVRIAVKGGMEGEGTQPDDMCRLDKVPKEPSWPSNEYDAVPDDCANAGVFCSEQVRL